MPDDRDTSIEKLRQQGDELAQFRDEERDIFRSAWGRLSLKVEKGVVENILRYGDLAGSRDILRHGSTLHLRDLAAAMEKTVNLVKRVCKTSVDQLAKANQTVKQGRDGLVEELHAAI